MMPSHQERLDVKVFLKVMLLFLTLAREAFHHLLRSRFLAARQQREAWSQTLWCGGVPSNPMNRLRLDVRSRVLQACDDLHIL